MGYEGSIMKGKCKILLSVSISTFISVSVSCLHVEQDGDETVRVVAMDKDFHVDCYHCEVSVH